MKCKICSLPISKSRVYCSYACAGKGRIGSKRPDLTARNLTNNPISNPVSKQKMIRSLTGRKQSKETVSLRVSSIAKLHKEDPGLRMRQTVKVRDLASKKPAGWLKIRKTILERDGYSCQECGKKDTRLIVHHIDHRGRNLKSHKDMNNKPDNLITLCAGCHISIHTWAVRKSRSPDLV